MKKWNGLAAFAAVACTLLGGSTNAWADYGLYAQVRALYENAGVPDSKALRANTLWTGKCVYASDEDKRYNGLVFFYVDEDPVVGNNFYMVPKFSTPDDPSYDYERNDVSNAIACGKVRSVVTLDNIEGAWRSDIQEDNGWYTYFLRQGTTKSGQPAFFLKEVVESGARAYCYYFQPTPGTGTGTVVAPPPLQ